MKQICYFLFLPFLIGCGPDCSETAMEIDKHDTATMGSLKSFISKIEKKEEVNSNINAEKIDFYVDVSGGMMHKGINASQEILDFLIPELLSPNTNYYQIGDNTEPQKFPFKGESVSDKAVILEYFKNTKSYQQPTSKLDVAIKSIVNNPNNSSIYITDFLIDYANCQFPLGKPYSNPIMAWASDDFKKWLSDGHKIDVFGKSYTDQNQHAKTDLSKIYFFFFTPKELIGKETKYNKLIKKLQKKFVNGSSVFHFEFRTDMVSVKKNYSDPNGGALTGGYGGYAELSPSSDFYSFSVADLIDNEVILIGKEQKILSKITLNNGLKYFPNIQLTASEYDITDSYVDYICNQTSPAINAGTASNMFVFNQGNGDTLSVSFNNINKQSISTSRLYRIDITIKESPYKNAQEELKPLSWTHLCKNNKDVTNSALMKSIINALEHIDESEALKGEKLFSYYILLNPKNN